MPKFNVELRYPPPRRVTKSLATRLRRALGNQIRLIDAREDGGIVMTLVCEAENAARAANVIGSKIGAGLAGAPAAVAAHPVEGVRVHPAEDPYGFAPLVGIAEIADLLGVTRQRASVLARSTAFPRPLQKLKMGPVYSKDAVLHYRDRRHIAQ